MSKRINSKAKGCRGERAFRDTLRAAGYSARRGQQFSGSPDSPDVICDDLPDVHFEVKCCQAGHGKTYDWVTQAGQDCRSGQARVVAHKSNGMYWLATLPMCDFLEIIRRSDLPRLSNGLRHDAFITTETGCHHFKDKTVRECLDVMGVPHNGKGKVSIP